MESGLYSKWKKDSFKDNGYNGTFDDLSKEPQFKFEVETFYQMDEKYLLLFGLFISISIFLLEIFYFFGSLNLSSVSQNIEENQEYQG